MTDHLGEELFLLHALTEAQRSLLGMRRRGDARDALEAFVGRLGGSVAPAHPPEEHALPLDISLGSGEPLVPVAAPGTPVRERLERTLPELVRRPTDLWARLEGHGLAILALRSTEERTTDLLGEVVRRWPEVRDLEVDLRTADLPVETPGVAALERLEATLGLTRSDPAPPDRASSDPARNEEASR